MFFPEKITSIVSTDFVLDIGPGSKPFERADVFIDKKFNKNDAFEQSGFAIPERINEKLIYFDGNHFPFMDGQFDYVVCSHVIEHVPEEDLGIFIKELERISKKGGYLEYPNVFYELVNFQPVHRWFIKNREDTLLLFSKSNYAESVFPRIFRKLFYASKTHTQFIFRNYREIFFEGFEWHNEIKYKIVNNIEDLVTEAEIKKIEKQLLNQSSGLSKQMKAKNDLRSFIKKRKIIYRILKKIRSITHSIKDIFAT